MDHTGPGEIVYTAELGWVYDEGVNLAVDMFCQMVEDEYILSQESEHAAPADSWRKASFKDFWNPYDALN